jgi:hypothetical protein
MRIIRKIDPLSVMKIAAICYGAIGLIEGAVFSVVFSLVPLTGHDGRQIPRFFGVLFGGFSIIFFPILFAVMGAVGGGLMAAVYNVVARYVGGIQVEVE